MTRSMISGLVLLVMILAGMAQAGPSKDIAKDAVKEFNVEFRAIRPSHLLLPVNYIETGGHSYGYGVSRRFARLARDGELFRIRKFKVKKRHVLLELETEHGAKLKFQIFDKNRVSQVFLDEVVPAVLQSLFEFGTMPPQAHYVGNTNSQLIHLGGCNHLPSDDLRRTFVDIGESEAAGFSPCAVCFPAETVLPFEGYTQLRMRSTEQARLFELAYPRVEDPEIQAMVSQLGERIVAEFPLDPVGFDYEFAVVHSPLPNAYSVSTGYVYVTDSLVKVVEHPAELEFVLAHEIAHCELTSPPIGLERPNIPTGMSNPYKYVFEWLRFQETTADLIAVLYLAQTNPEFADEARSILAKLQFAHEALPVPESDDYDRHPTFNERLQLFDEQAFVPAVPGPPLTFEPNGADGPVEVRVLGKARSEKQSYLYLLVEGSDLMNKPWKPVRHSGGGWAFASIEFTDGTRYDMTNLWFNHEIGAGDVQVVIARFGNEKKFAELDINTPVTKIEAAAELEDW